jgi:single-strand DNA-binding protein
MARSLNRVQLIGNLTRDPELRYTPSGTAVCSFSIATNRSWTTDTGEKKEEVDFHRIVAWNKLAELCSQFLVKGRKVYVEGRLQTRSWAAQDGTQKQTTEIIINDMILIGFQKNRRKEVVAAEEPAGRSSQTGKNQKLKQLLKKWKKKSRSGSAKRR